MSTPTRIRHAIENYFGGHDQEIMREILAVLDSHYRSPWIFSQDAQPEVDTPVITVDDPAKPFDATVCCRPEGVDWLDPECAFWWMHVPPLPEGGLLRVQESVETRVDTGHEGGHQETPGGGALADPGPALLISMATCLNHGFGLLDKDAQESMLYDMRKLWDEVMGRGYYSPQNRDRYLAALALPEGGDQTAQESPENRMDTGGAGGDQSDTPFAWWKVLIGALADEHAAAAGAVAALRAQCAPHEDIQAAVNVANSARAELLQHVRIGCAEHNNKES